MTITTMPPEAPPQRHRGRTTLLIGGLFVLAVAGLTVGGLNGLFSEGQGTPPPAVSQPTTWPTPAAPVIQPTTEAPTIQAALPDGCLGGPDAHTAVLTAQQSALLDDTGAAEFALAFHRWTLTIPYSPDADAVLAQVMIDPSMMAANVAQINQDQSLTGTVYRTTGAPRYRLLANDAGSAVVEVGVAQQVTPAPAQTSAAPIAVVEYHLTAKDGHWWIADALPPPTGDPTFTVGFSPFFGGCDE